MQPGSEPPRLLLLEFISTERRTQYRNEAFPFLQSYARLSGVPVRWVCFGHQPAVRGPSRFIVGLSPADTSGLCDLLRDFRPTHIASNERFEDELLRTVQDSSPGVSIAFGQEVWNPVMPTVDVVRQWLRLPAMDGHSGWITDLVEPDYACEPANSLAAEIKPFVRVVAGPICFYARPLSDNPYYAALELPERFRRWGCTFCGAPTTLKYPYATPPVELAVRQIRAAARTCPAWRFSGDFDIDGIACFFQLRRLTDALLSEPLPPTALYFSCRFDEVERMAPVIDETLPRLAAAGHSIRIHAIGAENLSHRENERLNKGLRLDQIESALSHLSRWEREWPSVFSFWKHGGVGFITFTPWTTLDDLDANVAAAERLGLEDSALLVTSRLVLIPGRPITLLAEHDGLLLSDFEVAAKTATPSLGCIVDWSQTDSPWRFAHSEVAQIYGILTRLYGPPRPQVDEPSIAEGLVELERSAIAGSHKPVRVLATLVRAAREAANPSDGAELLRRGMALLSVAQASAMPPHLIELCDRVSRVVRALEEMPGRPLRGFVLQRAWPSSDGPGWGEVSVAVQRDGERLCLLLRPSDAGCQAFVKLAHVSLSYRSDCTLDTPDKIRVATTIAAATEKYVFGRGGRPG